MAYLDVVDPDVGRAIQGDGVATPDVLGVQLGDVNVLEDDVADAVGESQALATDDTRVTNTNNGLVRGDVDGAGAGIVVGDFDRTSVRLIVATPIVGVDGQLATGGSTPGSTARLGGGALSAGEVELLAEDDGERVRGRQVRDQLVDCSWSDGFAVGTASGSSGESWSFA